MIEYMNQNRFAYQPTLDTLELKKYKGTNYVLNWKLMPMYTAFLHSMTLSGYRTGTKFNKGLLAVEQNNYLNKIINVYIVYDLDALARNQTNSFKFKNCLFRATNVVKNSDKENFVYSGYGITFDSTGSSSFDYNFARIVLISLVRITF